MKSKTTLFLTLVGLLFAATNARVRGEESSDRKLRGWRDRTSFTYGKQARPQPFPRPFINDPPTPPPTPKPSTTPTSEPVSGQVCNVCRVAGASVGMGANIVPEFDGASTTCAELETTGAQGQLSADMCDEAQTLAVTYCGCTMDTKTRPGPNTCDEVPTDQLEIDWLEAHNSRREFWHAFYEVEFANVCWDSSLAEQAQFYADQMASTCTRGHDLTRPDDDWQFCRRAGENLAYDNAGTADYRSPEQVLRGWADLEYIDDHPNDGHFTQVLWRSSYYIGCGSAFNANCDGTWTNYQVCRYVRYGNCNCEGDCRDEMLEDDSFCGPTVVDQTVGEYASCYMTWKTN